MKKLLLLSLLLSLSACASSKTGGGGTSSITLVRAGGFSGLEDKYMIERNGHATKTMRFPKEEERRVTDTTLPLSDVRPIFSFIDRNLDSLRGIRYDETGNMTTTLILTPSMDAASSNDTRGHVPHIIRWPNLEPPILPTNKLDSLYLLISPVQKWLSSSQ
jgi:hypothetical protein